MAATAMSFGDSANRPRKLAARTYGKTSRDQKFNFQDEIFSPISDQADDEWAVPEELTSRKPAPKTYSSKKSSAGTSSSNHNNNGTSATTTTTTSRATLPPSRHVSRKPSPPISSDSLSAFDVPSSDDDTPPVRHTHTIKHTAQHRFREASAGPTATKKKASATITAPKTIPSTAATENTTKPITKSVFDVPLSDEEKVGEKQLPANKRRHGSNTVVKSKEHADKKIEKTISESESSNSLNARKRRRTTPVPSLATDKPLATESKPRPKVAIGGQPSKPAGEDLPLAKAQDKSTGGRDTKRSNVKVSIPTSPRPEGPSTGNRRRGKTPTTPTIPPRITKGVSAPASLHGMLPLRSTGPSHSFARPTQPAPIPEDPVDQDVFMSSPSTPPKSATSAGWRSPTISSGGRPGSVTPKQALLWRNLLEEDSPATAFASVKLQSLTLGGGGDGDELSRQPASLKRSISDIIQPSNPRRVRLIDTLIEEAPSSDIEAESDQDNDDDDDDNSDVAVHQKRQTEDVDMDVPIQDSNHESMEKEPSASQGSYSQSDSLSGSQGMVGISGGPKVTYGRQRSYLQETTLEEALELVLPTESERSLPVANRRKAGGKRNALGFKSQPSLMSIDDDSDDAPVPIRSIHDLRASGTNRRFENEVEALLEDIEDTSSSAKSRRRSGLIELCTKLADEKFASRLIDHGLDQRLFAKRPAQSDPIFGFALAAAIAYLAKAAVAPNVCDNIIQSGTLVHLAFLLDEETDIIRLARDRRNNLSKVAQSSVAELHTLVRESSLFKDPRPERLSPQCLALRSIELLIKNMRKHGSLNEALEGSVLSRILKITTNSCNIIQEDLASSQTPSDTMLLKLALSTLESASLGADRHKMCSQETIEPLLQSITSVFGILQHLPSKMASLGMRLCLNVTNNNAVSSEQFSGSPIIQPLLGAISRGFKMLMSDINEREREEVLDCLILALGAMINLAEYSNTARFTVLSNGDSDLEELLAHFRTGLERTSQADSFQESQMNVPFGYLNVLLANLCQNEHVRRRVGSRLPGQSLNTLITAVDEFIRYHQKVDTEEFETEEGHDVWAAFTARLQAVVDRLRESEL